jgi:hypothetical protein
MSIVLMAFVSPSAAKVIYVDANAPGPTHDGSSWANAYKHLQDALSDADSAAKPIEIRVAEGVYKPDRDITNPDGTRDRYVSFWLINGVAVKGGYAGYGHPEPNKRDPNTYESILSGDLDGNDVEVNDPCDLLYEPTRAENSYHIVFSMAINASAVLDGFTITGGNAYRQDFPFQGSGGGFYCDDYLPGSPTVTNCSFIANSALGGGAMANVGSSFEECNPTLTNCTFSRNWAMWGGAIINSGWFGGCNPTLTNCTFTGNAAGMGGGVRNNGAFCNIKLTNCTFTGNSANFGGGISNSLNYAEVTNCTFTGNSAQNGGCIYNRDNDANVKDCTFSHNSAQNGGGVFNEDSSSVILVNCLFNGNSADSDGGGMSNSAMSSSTLTNCIFTGNSASKGGGAFNDTGGNVILANCTLNGNKASYGGAIYCQNIPPEPPPPPPSNQGPEIANETIWDYTQSDIYDESRTIETITNCILWGNEAPNGPQIYLGPNSIASVSYSDVEGGERDVYLDAVSQLNWGLGNIDADPCFVQPGYWGPVIIPLPGQASVPNPTDGATNVNIISGLSWTAGSGATSHDVYFGTTSVPPFIGNQTSTTFDPGTMAYLTTYSWRIDELNIGGKTTGQLWSFTTMQSPPPPPPPPPLTLLLPPPLLPKININNAEQYIWVDGDYHLRLDSPCINAGDPNYLAAPNEIDLDGRERVFGGRIDMGAYEYQVPTIYVDTNAPGPTHDGSSWANAYKHLQDALADAGSDAKPVEILIAQGIYKPDQSSADPCGSGDQFATFQLINGVTLKGGYAGFGKTDPYARDIEFYETILNGDLNDNDGPNFVNMAENSFHVVTGSSTEPNAVLDGLTISGGLGTGMYNYGGSPALANCTFSNNLAGKGGAMYNTHFSDPVVTNCKFSLNQAGENGGAMCNENSNPVVTGCTFVANSTMRLGGRFGGAVYNEGCSPTFDYCTFSENLSEHGGGGMYNNNSSPTLTNCTFEGNWARLFGGGLDSVGPNSCPLVIGCTFIGNSADERGGGTSNGTSSLTLINCIFIDNSATNEGGAMNSCNGKDINVSNCTFYGNEAPNGNLLNFSCSQSDVQFTNCILWDGGNEIWNPRGSIITITYSNVYEGQMSVYDPCESIIWGAGNIETDPCFADPCNGDYHLKSQAGRWDASSENWVRDDVTSPCIDSGNPGCPLRDEPNDSNNVRINMGAYGGTAEASKSLAYWRSIADMTNDWAIDNNDLKVFVAYWLQKGECIPSDLDRNGSVDFNDFAIFGSQ